MPPEGFVIIYIYIYVNNIITIASLLCSLSPVTGRVSIAVFILECIKTALFSIL